MAEGLAAIEREVASRGSDDDRVCLRYILHARTGDLPRRRVEQGGVAGGEHTRLHETARDCARVGGATG